MTGLGATEVVIGLLGLFFKVILPIGIVYTVYLLVNQNRQLEERVDRLERLLGEREERA